MSEMSSVNSGNDDWWARVEREVVPLSLELRCQEIVFSMVQSLASRDYSTVLHAYTVLHTISINVCPDMRGHLTSPTMNTRFQSISKGKSNTLAAGLTQLLCDWEFLFWNEPLGHEYKHVLTHLRNTNRGAPFLRISDAAAHYQASPTTNQVRVRATPIRGFNFQRFNQRKPARPISAQPSGASVGRQSSHGAHPTEHPRTEYRTQEAARQVSTGPHLADTNRGNSGTQASQRSRQAPADLYDAINPCVHPAVRSPPKSSQAHVTLEDTINPLLPSSTANTPRTLDTPFVPEGVAEENAAEALHPRSPGTVLPPTPEQPVAQHADSEQQGSGGMDTAVAAGARQLRSTSSMMPASMGTRDSVMFDPSCSLASTSGLPSVAAIDAIPGIHPQAQESLERQQSSPPHPAAVTGDAQVDSLKGQSLHRLDATVTEAAPAVESAVASQRSKLLSQEELKRKIKRQDRADVLTRSLVKRASLLQMLETEVQVMRRRSGNGDGDEVATRLKRGQHAVSQVHELADEVLKLPPAVMSALHEAMIRAKAAVTSWNALQKVRPVQEERTALSPAESATDPATPVHDLSATATAEQPAACTKTQALSVRQVHSSNANGTPATTGQRPLVLPDAYEAATPPSAYGTPAITGPYTSRDSRPMPPLSGHAASASPSMYTSSAPASATVTSMTVSDVTTEGLTVPMPHYLEDLTAISGGVMPLTTAEEADRSPTTPMCTDDLSATTKHSLSESRAHVSERQAVPEAAQASSSTQVEHRQAQETEAAIAALTNQPVLKDEALSNDVDNVSVSPYDLLSHVSGCSTTVTARTLTIEDSRAESCKAVAEPAVATPEYSNNTPSSGLDKQWRGPFAQEPVNGSVVPPSSVSIKAAHAEPGSDAGHGDAEAPPPGSVYASTLVMPAVESEACVRSRGDSRGELGTVLGSAAEAAPCAHADSVVPQGVSHGPSTAPAGAELSGGAVSRLGVSKRTTPEGTSLLSSAPDIRASEPAGDDATHHPTSGGQLSPTADTSTEVGCSTSLEPVDSVVGASSEVALPQGALVSPCMQFDTAQCVGAATPESPASRSSLSIEHEAHALEGAAEDALAVHTENGSSAAESSKAHAHRANGHGRAGLSLPDDAASKRAGVPLEERGKATQFPKQAADSTANLPVTTAEENQLLNAAVAAHKPLDEYALRMAAFSIVLRQPALRLSNPVYISKVVAASATGRFR